MRRLLRISVAAPDAPHIRAGPRQRCGFSATKRPGPRP